MPYYCECCNHKSNKKSEHISHLDSETHLINTKKLMFALNYS